MSTLLWIGAVLLLILAFWVVASSKSDDDSDETQTDEDDDVRENAKVRTKKQRVLEANRHWLDKRWEMAEAERVSGELKHFPRWYFDEPTERQREKLKRDEVKVSGNATKGQLSDLIGLFVPPESEDLEKLRFFGIELKGEARNQTRARHELAFRPDDPDKERAWLMRPANGVQKEFFRFTTGKVPKGLTAAEAAARMAQAMEQMTEEQRDEWSAFESLLDEFEDREFLVDMRMRKPSVADIRAAMAEVKAAGGDFEDCYEVADKILELKPALARD